MGWGRGWNTSNPGVDEALQSEPAVMPRELSGSEGNAAIASRLFYLFFFVFFKNQENTHSWDLQAREAEPATPFPDL